MVGCSGYITEQAESIMSGEVDAAHAHSNLNLVVFYQCLFEMLDFNMLADDAIHSKKKTQLGRLKLSMQEKMTGLG